MTASTVDVLRGGEVESRHRVFGVVVGLSEGEEVRYGDPTRLAFWRSSMKPFQALPLLESGAAEAFEMDDRELALCCGSHVGRAEHVDGVAGLLARLGLDPSRLYCGPHPPFDGATARRIVREGGEFTALHNNCSGKHAGMLALAVHHGWPVEGYAEADHPVQARIRSGLSRWLDVDPAGLAWGTDGCGVPTPYLSLRQMARAYARLGRAAARGEDGPAAVVRAMTGEPELVSGPGRPVTRIMRATGGRILAKEGAEGVFCLAAPDAGWGMALKVSDGSRRAASPAVVDALAERGLLSEEERDELEDLRRPPLTNTRGHEVGHLAPRMVGEVTSAVAGP